MRRLSKIRKRHTLLRLAAHIRRWPHLFDFWRSRVPKKGAQCQACMLARAGVMIGAKAGSNDLNAIARALGWDDRGHEDAEGRFYDSVNAALRARGSNAGLSNTPAAAIAMAIEDVAVAL